MKSVSLLLLVCMLFASTKGQQPSCSSHPGPQPSCPVYPPPSQELKDHVFGMEDVVIDETTAQAALHVLALFESANPKQPWRSLGPFNQISFGFLQWNAGTETLYSQLFPKITVEDIALADPAVQSDLQTLKAYSIELNKKSPIPSDLDNKKKATLLVIKSWKTAKPNDPLVNKIRKSIRAKVGDWLDIPKLRTAQRMVIDERYLKPAMFYAQLWQQDSGSQKPFNARLLAYFLDMTTFNGDPHGMWVEHVRCFRSKYPGTNAVDAIVAWVTSCKHFPVKLARIDDAVASASYWLKHKTEMDDDQLDLLVLGFLVALKSTGKENGVRGYFQADVVTRRGLITVGGSMAGKEVPDVMSLP